MEAVSCFASVGRLNCINGESYDGLWKDDLKNGEGEFNYANGGKYVGDWVEDRKEGRGKSVGEE